MYIYYYILYNLVQSSILTDPTPVLVLESMLVINFFKYIYDSKLSKYIVHTENILFLSIVCSIMYKLIM